VFCLIRRTAEDKHLETSASILAHARSRGQMVMQEAVNTAPPAAIPLGRAPEAETKWNSFLKLFPVNCFLIAAVVADGLTRRFAASLLHSV